MASSWLTFEDDVEVGEDTVYEGFSGVRETNAYEFKIVMAKVVPSASSKAESVVLDLETRDGEEMSAQFWIKNSSGVSYYVDRKRGNKIALPDVLKLNAVATILNLEGAPKRKKALVEEYDFKEKENKEVEREIFPELIGKFIGGCVTIVRTNKQEKVGDEYVDVAGHYDNPELTHFFRVTDGKFASEIKASKDPKELDKWKKRNTPDYIKDKRTIKDYDSEDYSGSNNSSSSSGGSESKTGEEDTSGDDW
jgi:hypothetical protein